MSIKEDRDEFQNSGINGLLLQLMREGDGGFVRVLPGGWRGEIVPDRPEAGSGPYIEFRRGNPPMRYGNTPEDETVTEYRLL